MKRDSHEAKQLLLQYRDRIQEKIGEIKQFTQFEISLPGLDGTVEKVLSLTLDDIQSAVWKEKDKDAGRLLFSLKATLIVLVSRLSLDFFNPTFQVGGEKFTPRFSRAPEEQRLEKMLFGEASFTINKEGKFELTGLRIDKSPPEAEDLARLVRS